MRILFCIPLPFHFFLSRVSTAVGFSTHHHEYKDTFMTIVTNKWFPSHYCPSLFSKYILQHFSLSPHIPELPKFSTVYSPFHSFLLRLGPSFLPTAERASLATQWGPENEKEGSCQGHECTWMSREARPAVRTYCSVCQRLAVLMALYIIIVIMADDWGGPCTRDGLNVDPKSHWMKH